MRNRIGSFFLLALFTTGCIPSTIQQTSSIMPASGVAIPSHVMRIAVVSFRDSREDQEEFPNLMTRAAGKNNPCPGIKNRWIPLIRKTYRPSMQSDNQKISGLRTRIELEARILFAKRG